MGLFGKSTHSRGYTQQIKRQKREAELHRKAERAEEKRKAEIERLRKRTELFNLQAKEKEARYRRKTAGKPKVRRERPSRKISRGLNALERSTNPYAKRKRHSIFNW